jgi:rhodanese-related sulfurtransferase
MRLFARSFLICLGLFSFAPVLHATHGSEAHLKIEEIEVGQGLEALPYSVVDVHYTGRLDGGKVFDSSIERGEPLRFTLGTGQVIPGWDMGIEGMKAGGKRVLEIPPELAYGSRGAGGVIPPNARLTFNVELVAVEPPAFESISSAKLESKLEQGIKLIDIRRPEEWQQTGVVEGSVKSTAFNAGGQFLESFADMLEKTVQPDEEFAVICRTGNRTAALSNWLVKKGGYRNVINVRDGITAWIEEGRPVDKVGNQVQ